MIGNVNKNSALQLSNQDLRVLPTINRSMEEWISKLLHGEYPQNLRNSNIELSTTWLKIESLFPEKEGFVLAIQDSIIAKKNYQSCIEKLSIDIGAESF